MSERMSETPYVMTDEERALVEQIEADIKKLKAITMLMYMAPVSIRIGGKELTQEHTALVAAALVMGAFSLEEDAAAVRAGKGNEPARS